MIKRLGFALLLVTLYLSFCSVGFSGTFVAFGPESYQRGSGSPITVTHSFTVLNPNTAYTLKIYNGGLADGEFEKVNPRAAKKGLPFWECAQVLTCPLERSR